MVSMDEKINEYKNVEMRNNLELFKQDCSQFRSIRGDGNCFYRALAFGFFE